MGEKPVFDLVKKNDFEKIVACLVLKLMRRMKPMRYLIGIRGIPFSKKVSEKETVDLTPCESCGSLLLLFSRSDKL